MRILELGTGIALAFAGHLLVAHGHTVHKWIAAPEQPDDTRLWDWLNADKFVEQRPIIEVKHVPRFDVVIESVPILTLASMHIDPANTARERQLIWVSIRTNKAPYLAGLYAAFLSVATRKPGWRVVAYDPHIRQVMKL